MNFDYWDRHKVATILAAILILTLWVFTEITVFVEDRAWEHAADSLSYSDAQSVLKYFDLYKRNLPSINGLLNSITNLLWWIMLASILYSAWTALDIPERYQLKKEIQSD